ncbi:DUF58 domain-containing protein [Epidermidibacterium keratini]|uniref:DUF58 domain-containing protein n=1 Tax=Epidermidibacterium keratini TaxID=1891644 RepID=A0A7L4YK22_9ACTN|nr:DUF58 domain-containing protein [Epidermidibacterium keratini]QHB99148.1 DUF58 domain-containing protein [Epidermidibacterium keratini]
MSSGKSRVSFTTRGSSLIAAGVATAIGAVVLGETDLLRIAVALIVLCGLCWVYLKLSGLRVHTRHVAVPDEAPIGTPVGVQVALRIEHRLLMVDLVAEDATTGGLTDAPRLGVDPSAATKGMTLRYSTAAHHRGMHLAGGTTATMQDPFGIAEIRVRTTDQVAILGLPHTVRVDRGWLRSLSAQDGLARAGNITALSEPDVDVREHRAEDGLRRVHWRTSARIGRLMVRPDEPVEDRADVITLDTRSKSHFGHSFETLVELAASLARAVTDSGGTVELRTWDGARIGERAFTDSAPLLRALAMLEPDARGEYVATPTPPTVLITTESANLRGLPRARTGHRPLAIVLTHRDESSKGLHEHEHELREHGIGCVHHSAREPAARLFAHPPVLS